MESANKESEGTAAEDEAVPPTSCGDEHTVVKHRTKTFHSSLAELKRKQVSTMKPSCWSVLGLVRKGPTPF